MIDRKHKLPIMSITMDVSFCLDAIEKVLSVNEKPEIFNTDQGSQFTARRLQRN